MSINEDGRDASAPSGVVRVLLLLLGGGVGGEVGGQVLPQVVVGELGVGAGGLQAG